MEGLPIQKYESDIISAISSNEITCIIGKPGTGKSTQVPQFLLSYPQLFPKEKLIGITQPRRVAALGVFNRLRDELVDDTKLGLHIGNERKLCSDNLLKIMTDGILLRELQGDMLLQRYSVVIIDEVQARRVNTDLLCSLLVKIAIYRKSVGFPLKIVFLSADIEAYQFICSLDSKLKPFLIEVEGAPFKVSNHFLSVDPEDFIESSFNHAKQIHKSLPEGSILVFLPGKSDINNLQRKIVSHNWDRPLCPIPLHSQLSQDQLKLNLSHSLEQGKRLIYISTNIAETSVTLPNIKYVIDCGKVKKRIYSADTKTFQYIVTWESKASAKQRAGRAGRTVNGHCYYLFTNQTYFSKLPETDEPEISVFPLESSILSLLALGISQYTEVIESLHKFSGHEFRLAHESLRDMDLVENDMSLKFKGLLCASFPFSFISSYLISSFFGQSPKLIYTALVFAYLMDNTPERLVEIMHRLSRKKQTCPSSDIIAIVDYFHSETESFLTDFLAEDFRMTMSKCSKLLDQKFDYSDTKLSYAEMEQFCRVLAKNFKSNIAIRVKSSSSYEIQLNGEYIICEIDDYSLLRSDFPKYVVYLGALKTSSAIKLQYLTRLQIT